MTRVIAMHDLPTETRELLVKIAADDEIIIEEGGHPLVRITPMPAEMSSTLLPRPPLGQFKGQVWLAPDFDEELPLNFWCPPGDATIN
jgi:antitoxin (DNA-binding transcriptional repressor) of toxin-antitoxin stability system